jgi:hypothetical protein
MRNLVICSAQYRMVDLLGLLVQVDRWKPALTIALDPFFRVLGMNMGNS